MSLAAPWELISWYVATVPFKYIVAYLNEENNPAILYEIWFQLLHQAVATPILYDFYNYDVDRKEFGQLFSKFTQVSKSNIVFFVGYPCLALSENEV